MRKPVFVMYISMRVCNNNPSMQRFDNLPAMEQDRLLDRLEERGHKIRRHKHNVLRFKRKKSA